MSGKAGHKDVINADLELKTKQNQRNLICRFLILTPFCDSSLFTSGAIQFLISLAGHLPKLPKIFFCYWSEA